MFKENLKTEDRQKNDFYATEPKNVEEIVKLENIKNLFILEPCAGEGHMAKVLQKYNKIETNELYNSEYKYKSDYNFCFLEFPKEKKYDAVVMNPPYKLATEFILKGLEVAPKVYVLLRLNFLEGQKRNDILYSKKYLKKVYVYSYRIRTVKNADFSKEQKSAIAFAWFVFEREKTENPQIFWIKKFDEI